MTTLTVDKDWCETPEIDISIIDDITRILMTPETTDTQVDYRRQRHTIITLARLSVAATDDQLNAAVEYLTRCEPAIAIYGVLEFMRRNMRRILFLRAMSGWLAAHSRTVIGNKDAIRTVCQMQKHRDSA